MANRYKKILKTLKEAPTNRTGGLYQLGPVGQRLVPPDKGKTWFPDADGNFPDSIPGGVDGEPYYFREPAVQNGESIDKVFVKGKMASLIFKNISKAKKGRILNNKSQIIELIRKDLNNNDYLMIKASNATGLNKIVKKIKGFH